jgi:hypothetical protein
MATPNITFVGAGANITWGTSDAGEAPNGGGVVISASERKSGETIPVLNNQGVPDGLVIVPGLTEVSIEAYAKSGTPPAIGDIANIAGVNVYVDSAETTWEQKGIKKVRFGGKSLPA